MTTNIHGLRPIRHVSVTKIYYIREDNCSVSRKQTAQFLGYEIRETPDIFPHFLHMWVVQLWAVQLGLTMIVFLLN